MNVLTPFVALNIYNYYPDDIIYTSILDEDTNKYSAALIRLENGDPLEVLFSLDHFHYSSGQRAINALSEMIERAMLEIKPGLN